MKRNSKTITDPILKFSIHLKTEKLNISKTSKLFCGILPLQLCIGNSRVKREEADKKETFIPFCLHRIIETAKTFKIDIKSWLLH